MMEEIKIDNEIYVKKSSIKTTTKAVSKNGKEFCIIRTYSAGVFVGYIDRKIKGMERTIYDSRRVWYWDGASSLSQLANEGTKKPGNCKIAQIVSETDLNEVIEIIPCTENAKDNILGVKVWQE